jgi:hypothetical protein
MYVVMVSTIAMLCFLLGGGSTPTVMSLHAGSETASKLSPRLAPEYVNLLKDQAKARKSLFEEQASKKQELKTAQGRERQELLEIHRAARAKFNSESHCAAERKAFYESLRKQMADLKARQADDLKKFESETKQNLADFDSQQKQELHAMKEKLAHGNAAQPAGSKPVSAPAATSGERPGGASVPETNDSN